MVHSVQVHSDEGQASTFSARLASTLSDPVLSVLVNTSPF